MMQNKRLVTILIISAFLLLIPLLAMQFTNEVNWTFADFIVASVLLIGASLAIETALRLVTQTKYRIAISLTMLAMFLLIWTELAVGIFGTPFAGN